MKKLFAFSLLFLFLASIATINCASATVAKQAFANRIGRLTIATPQFIALEARVTQELSVLEGLFKEDAIAQEFMNKIAFIEKMYEQDVQKPFCPVRQDVEAVGFKIYMSAMEWAQMQMRLIERKKEIAKSSGLKIPGWFFDNYTKAQNAFRAGYAEQLEEFREAYEMAKQTLSQEENLKVKAIIEEYLEAITQPLESYSAPQ